MKMSVTLRNMLRWVAEGRMRKVSMMTVFRDEHLISEHLEKAANAARQCAEDALAVKEMRSLHYFGGWRESCI